MMKKKILSILMSLLMAAALMPGMSHVAYASDNIIQQAGNCGQVQGDDFSDNAAYTYDVDSGELVISGTGEIGARAFADRTNKANVQKVVINPGITEISPNAFEGLTGVTSVSLPEGLLNISAFAFYNCFALDAIDLPDTLEKIDTQAFYNDGIAELDIPASMKELNWDAFGAEEGYGNLQKVIMRSSDIVFTQPLMNRIPNSINTAGPIGGDYDYQFTWTEKIPDQAFAYLMNRDSRFLSSIVLPSTITEIGASAFSGQYNLEDIEFPNGLSSIKDYAFFGTGLTEVNLPVSVTKIGREAFNSCSKLEKITIQNPSCEINDDFAEGKAISTGAVIAGFDTSTAQTFALTYGRTFESLGDVTDKRFSICSYDSTNSKSMQGGQFKVIGSHNPYSLGLSYGCNNYTLPLGEQMTVTAYPDNGYRFIGWYNGEYIGQDESGNYIQDARPYPDQEPVSTNVVYAFTISDDTVICPVFVKADVVNYVDVGNIWSVLDPINEIPFTGEVNPNEEGLEDYIEVSDEAWESTDGTSVFTPAASGIPALGKTYRYAIKISAKGDNVFDPVNGFRFVYGGTPYEWDEIDVSFADDNKTAVITGFIPDKKVEAIDISGATVTGIANKTYTGKALAQVPVVKMTVNGTAVTLRSGTDYTLSYKNNTNAGKATVTITGKSNYKGSAVKNFTIVKATNPLAVKGKTATVKYSKLKKKAQTLTVSKVIKFTKKLNDKKTYTLVSAKKGSKSFKKYFKINKTTGKVTIKKNSKMKKGTYKVKVKVKAAGNANYKASAVKTVTFKIKVK